MPMRDVGNPATATAYFFAQRVAASSNFVALP
jgi:hypothetical protein